MSWGPTPYYAGTPRSQRVFMHVRMVLRRGMRVKAENIRYRATWITRGTSGTEVYTSKVVDTEAEAVKLALRYLLTRPEWTDTTDHPERFGYALTLQAKA